MSELDLNRSGQMWKTSIDPKPALLNLGHMYLKLGKSFQEMLDLEDIN